MKQQLGSLLIALVFTVPVFTQDYSEVKALVDDGTYEASTMSFEGIDGSAEYMKRFGLNCEEVSLIGIWGLDVYRRRLDSDWYGPGPSIKFFPNRLYVAVSSNREKAGIQYFVGEWKVENGNLCVNFKARIIKVQDVSKNTQPVLKVERKQVNAYFPIFKVPKYSIAFVNNAPFDWSSVPEDYRIFYGINLSDAPRFRILFDTLGVPPGDLTLTGLQGKLMMTKTDTDAYFLDIIHLW